MIRRRNDATRAGPGLRELLTALEASTELQPFSPPPAVPPPPSPISATKDWASTKPGPSPSPPPRLPPPLPPAVPQARHDAFEPTLHALTLGTSAEPPGETPAGAVAQTTAPSVASASISMPRRTDALRPQTEAPAPAEPLEFVPADVDQQRMQNGAFIGIPNPRPAIERPSERDERWLLVAFAVIMGLAIACASAALLWQSAGTDPLAALVPSQVASRQREPTAADAAPAGTVAVRVQSIADLANLKLGSAALPAPQAAPESPPVPLTPSVGMADRSVSGPVRQLPLAVAIYRGPLAEDARIRLRGIPNGAQLSHGQPIGDDWVLMPADLGKLSLTLPGDAAGRWRFTFEVHLRDNPHVSVTSALFEVKHAGAPTPVAPHTALPELRKGEDEERTHKYLIRGQQLLTDGDVAAARTFFRMAAEAGDAEAAMAMGATHDPNHLLQFGVRGMQPDLVEAARWYRLALNLGSKDALDRIEALQPKK